MPSKANTLFGTPNRGIPAPEGKNYAGGGTYFRSLEEQTLQVLMTGVFEDTYYANQKTLVDKAVDLFRQMALKDAELFAKMVVYARNEGFMRISPITALVVLSTANLRFFSLAFPMVIRTPGDLQDFTTIVRCGSLRKGLGRGVKRVLGLWLNGLSEYHAIKYGSKGSDMSLRDILRIVHPKPATEEKAGLFNYLCNGLTPENAVQVATLQQIRAFEELKESTDPAEQKALIAKGRLPYEVVVGAIKPNTELWTSLMAQMPYFALLRHLNTLNKAGVFNDPKNVQYVVGRLTNEEVVRKSMILPFRFHTAWTTVDATLPTPIREALITALEISFQNVPVLAGRTAVGCDVSGSMSYQTLSPKGKTRPIDIAAVFTAALLKKSEDSIILPFDGSVRDASRLSARDTLMTTADTLARFGGGSTNVGAPIELLLTRKTKVDTFIGITDNESWVGRGFLPAWRQYKKEVNPNAQAFLLHVMPYNHAVAPQNEPGCMFFYGWSDGILSLISSKVNGGQSQLDAVRAITFSDSAPGVDTGDEEG